MSTQKTKQGFSLVEALVAILLSLFILITGNQVFSAVNNSSGSSRNKAKASNAAYEILRETQYSVSSPCSASSSTSSSWTQLSSLPNASATKTISCPFPSTNQDVSKVSVTISYGTNERSVTRAIFVTP